MNFLLRLRLRARLSLGFGVMLSFLLVIALLGVWSAERLHEGLRVVYEDRMVALQELAAVNERMLRNRILVMDMIAQPDADNLRSRSTEMASNTADIDQRLKAYRQTAMDERERAMANAFEATRASYVQGGLVQIRESLQRGQVEEAQRIYSGRTLPLLREAQAQLAKLIQLQVDIGAAEYAAAGQTRQRMLVVVAGGVLATLLIGVALAWAVTRSVAEPVAEATRAARRIRDGDLTTPLVPHGRDEVAELLQALQGMQQSLGDIVGSVRTNAEQVATASTQIAQGNQDLSGRTEAQASGLEQTAASMEELGATVRQNADSARLGNQLAQGASAVAQRGGEVVAQVVDTMQGINDSSRKIADIIGVIDGIAFQTNILALNAAVEAARAGEQGRGFAVVAGEVRNLAQRSAEAAKEIKSLITASVERVEQGATLVDQAGRTMQEIVTQIQRVTDLMGEISSASEEQRSGVEQIGQAVAQMDQATQQNAALVEQSAAAAESLNQQAEQLVRAVAVFRLRHDTPLAAVARPPTAPVPVVAQVKRVAVPSSAAPAPADAAKPKTAVAATTASPAALVTSSDDWETF